MMIVPTWKDYLALTKPRVISLLLLTTLLSMFVAAGGWPGLGLLVVVAIGGYMAAGSANAFNMLIDRDIDRGMQRTAARPTVTAKISTSHAAIFAISLMLGAGLLLWWGANLATALMALAGLGWYVLIYTLYMKRRFWNNIVIGGAAGAFPPLVGWAAVSGDVSLFAVYLFLIIFFWTPVHFWALALMIKDDYAAVKVPMLPVVRGTHITAVQIVGYAVLTCVVSLVPVFMGELGWAYLAAAAVLNGLLVTYSLKLYSYQLQAVPGRAQLLPFYKYSMSYLALLFLAMAIDRAL
jgi:heme o synthase